MARDRTQHFQIGVVSTGLETPLRGLSRRYRALYADFEQPGPGDREILIRVAPSRTRLFKRTRYEVSVNGRVRFEPCRRDEIVPYIEWAINWEVPRVMPEYLQIHASSMEVGGVGVIFPGYSGSGKSTLTAGLLAGGWRYLCDEFALIHADTLMLHPYPRAICVKQPSHAVVASLGLKLCGSKRYLKGGKGHVGFLRPTDVRPGAIGRSCSIGYVIFPTYTAGATPELIPVSRGEAAFSLHKVCFNLMNCDRLGVDVLAAMIRGASCYRLISGEIGATCRLVRALLEKSPQRQARCA